VFTIEYRVVKTIWRRSPISFKHVTLQCLLFDPHYIIYQSKSRGSIKKMSHLRPIYLTYIWSSWIWGFYPPMKLKLLEGIIIVSIWKLSYSWWTREGLIHGTHVTRYRTFSLVQVCKEMERTLYVHYDGTLVQWTSPFMVHTFNFQCLGLQVSSRKEPQLQDNAKNRQFQRWAWLIIKASLIGLKLVIKCIL